MFGNLNLMKLGRDNLSKNKSQNPTNENIYQELGDIEPFTPLAGGQFNVFISELSNEKNKYLTEAERKGFSALWHNACIDIDGFGNNIWQLPKGVFTIFDKENIRIKFYKKDSSVKDIYIEQGRADFFFLSDEGNFVIHQDDRNKNVFLVYVSKNLNQRLLNALRFAEAKALDIKYEHSEDVSLRPISR